MSKCLTKGSIPPNRGLVDSLPDQLPLEEVLAVRASAKAACMLVAVRLALRFVASAIAGSLALLAASAPAAAAPKPIAGKLSKPGYTVLALAASGEASSARATPRRFELRPPAKSATLHLRARNGEYAGPIVVGRDRKQAIIGVRAGSRLGELDVKVRAGYAKPLDELPVGSLASSRYSRARQGIPIGAGNYGRVRSRRTQGGAPGDRDIDGIPDPLDIDDDGDLILDSFESSTQASAAQSSPTTLPSTALGSDLTLELHQTVNVNAAASTSEQIDAALAAYGRLAIVILAGDVAELDCGGSLNLSPPPPLLGGLTYCSYGGTGRLFNAPMPPFPECCDDDGDGFGTMVNAPNFASPGTMFLNHGAASTQIGTGDVLIERVMTDGSESQFAATLQFVFATVPALVSYSDTAGNSAAIAYPVAADGPGTRENGLPAAADPDTGDVMLTVTLWRPQRRRMDRDPGTGEWIDIGGLNYTVLAGAAGDCPQSAFSTEDPNLTPSPPSLTHGGGFADLAADQPASASNTFTYTLNATECLESKGITWNPGETQQFSFFSYTGDTGQENAQQPVFFTLQS